METPSFGLWVLVLLAGVLAYLILGTFWQYLFFAVLFAILFVRHYEWLAHRVHRNFAAMIIVAAVFLILVLPTLYVVSSTITQAPLAYQGALNLLDKPTVAKLLGYTSDEVRALAVTIGEKLRANVLSNAASYLAQASDVMLGLFLLFVTLFFLLRDGKMIYAYTVRHLPVGPKYAEEFFMEMNRIIRAVVLGQLVTAIIQGALAGFILFALGIPNALFWGVITTLLSVIPVLGPFLVYIPAAGYLLAQERYAAGIVLLVLGVVVLSQIDNIVRPYVASRSASIHPLTVILGVIGGLKLWGLVGFILGPLVLAGFLALYSFAMRSHPEHH